MTGHDGYTVCGRCAQFMHLHGPLFYARGQAIAAEAIKRTEAADAALKRSGETLVTMSGVVILLLNAIEENNTDARTALLRRASELLDSVSEKE